MCGRVASGSSAAALQEKTNARRFRNVERYRPSFNIGVGQWQRLVCVVVFGVCICSFARPQPCSNRSHPPVLLRNVDSGERELVAMRWGLQSARVPSSAASSGALATFNARLETLTSSPLWRPLLNTRRCVLVVDGFFEWTAPGARHRAANKQPHFARPKTRGLLYLACLYDEIDIGMVEKPIDQLEALAAADEESGESGESGERGESEPKATVRQSFSIITMRASNEIR